MSGLSRLGQGDIEQAIAYHETIAKFRVTLHPFRGGSTTTSTWETKSLLQIAEKVLLTVKIITYMA